MANIAKQAYKKSLKNCILEHIILKEAFSNPCRNFIRSLASAPVERFKDHLGASALFGSKDSNKLCMQFNMKYIVLMRFYFIFVQQSRNSTSNETYMYFD
jgi:hypothetical protein